MSTLASILAAESSKTPYFIAGGVFAAWAIVVSVIGLRSPDFPKTKAIGRATIGLSLALAASTLGLLIAVSG